MTEIWMNMVNTTFNSTEDLINNLQSLKDKTKLKFYKNLSIYYNNMNIRMDEDPLLEMLKVLVRFIMKFCC